MTKSRMVGGAAAPSGNIGLWPADPGGEHGPSGCARDLFDSSGVHASKSVLSRMNDRYSLITAIHKCGQAIKGVWWMPRRTEATKDATACDKLRGAGK